MSVSKHRARAPREHYLIMIGFRMEKKKAIQTLSAVYVSRWLCLQLHAAGCVMELTTGYV